MIQVALSPRRLTSVRPLAFQPCARLNLLHTRERDLAHESVPDVEARIARLLRLKLHPSKGCCFNSYESLSDESDSQSRHHRSRRLRQDATRQFPALSRGRNAALGQSG